MVLDWITDIFRPKPKQTTQSKPKQATQASRDQAELNRFKTLHRNQKITQKPSQAPAPAPVQQTYFAGGGGWGGGGGYVAPAPAPPTPPRLTDKEWLAKDSSYNAMLKSLENRLKGFETENTAQRERAIQDYNQALSRLGWNQDAKDWNRDDRTTAFGQAYQNLMNDFASRGLLQSSLYDQNRTDLQSMFGRQRDEMGQSHNTVLEDLARALANQRTEIQQARDQARMEALARRAALETAR